MDRTLVSGHWKLGKIGHGTIGNQEWTINIEQWTHTGNFQRGEHWT